MSVFALRRRPHLAAQVMHDVVQSVAHAQRRNAHRQHARVCIRRVGVVHRRRPARKNQSDRFVGFDLAQQRSARQHHGKNILLADAARDQLRILRSEIEDDDGLDVHAPVWQGAGSGVKNRSGRLINSPYGSFPAAASGFQWSFPARNTRGWYFAASRAVSWCDHATRATAFAPGPPGPPGPFDPNSA